jgi:hypothetical protein
MRRHFWVAIVAVGTSCAALAQSNSASPDSAPKAKSLSEIAAEGRQKNRTGKRVVTDESLAPSKKKPTLPVLDGDQLNDDEEMIDILRAESKRHSPQQFEAMVREWYDYHVRLTNERSAAYTAAVKIAMQRQKNRPEGPATPEELRETSNLERLRVSTRNAQSWLAYVQAGLQHMGLDYEWYEVPLQ